MAVDTETLIVIVSLALIVGAPLLAHQGFRFSLIETLPVRLLMVAAVLVAIRYGAIPGLFTFLAVFTLHLERTHQLLTTLPNQQPRWPTRAGQEGVPEMIRAGLPSLDSHGYEPPSVEEAKEAKAVVETHGEKITESEFESASDISDNNPRLGEVAQGEAASDFYEQRGLV